MSSGGEKSQLPMGRRLHFGLMLAASVLVPALLCAVYAWQSHVSAWASIQDRLSRRAAVLAEHTARVFDTYDLVIDTAERHLRDHLMDEPLANSMALADFAAASKFTSSILLLSADGQVVGSSNGPEFTGADASEREYFRAAPTDGLGVSGQFISRFTHDRLFALSRRVADGQVVAVLVYTSYFERLFGTMAGNDGLDGVVTLYRQDGRQLARHPPRDPAALSGVGMRALVAQVPRDAGFYTIPAEPGGGERYAAFNRVPGYPVYVAYCVDPAAALAPWRKDTATGVILALAAAALLLGITLTAARREQEVSRTGRRLERAVAERTAEVLDAVREREAALAQAERAHHAKAHFLAAASHDLRQPIQALRLFLDVLNGRLSDGENQKVLGHASKALKGAEDLLSALLDVSTLDAGMVKAAPQAVRLSTILDELAAEFASLARNRGIAFSFVTTSAWVRTDPVLLSRMLRNLLTNALRYTAQGAVLLGCRRTGDRLRIEVWDTGRGIPADKIEAVFEDFVQLGNPERDRTKGLGLGLAVVRRMAAMLDHPLQVRSREGRGTVFSVNLPRVAHPSEGE